MSAGFKVCCFSMCCSFWLVQFLKVGNYTFFSWWHNKLNSLVEIIVHFVVALYTYIYICFCFFCLIETKYITEDWIYFITRGNYLALVLILISNTLCELILDSHFLTTLTNMWKTWKESTIAVLSTWFATLHSHLLGHQAQLRSFITCPSISWNPGYLSQQLPQCLFSLFPKICEWMGFKALVLLLTDVNVFFFFTTHINTCLLLSGIWCTFCLSYQI